MATRLHHRLRAALRSFVRRRAVEQELDEELQFHYQQMHEYQQTRTPPRGAAGTSGRASGVPSSARRRAFGLDNVKEACRDMRTLRPLEHFLQDLRFGARLLMRGPVFAIVAILSLALGIGANSAIFSVINAIVLRSLPVERPDELHIAEVTFTDETHGRWSFPTFEGARDLLAGRAELCAVSAIRPLQIVVPGRDGATPQRESARVQLVSGEFFRVLRQRPQIGRLLGPEDNRTLDRHPVAIVSDAYWTRRFGRTPSTLGSTLTINGTPFTIVGVAAPEFFGTTVDVRPAEIWIPLMMQPAVRYSGNMSSINGDPEKPWPPQREISWLNIFLRVPPESVPAVTEAMNLALQRDAAQRAGYQDEPELRRQYQAMRASLAPGSRGLSAARDNMTLALTVLLLMVGLLLAIACANLASLLLARASNRQREMAIRLSIGAGRGRLIRQLLTESLLLALIGGAGGLLIAEWGSVALVTLPEGGNAAVGFDVGPDWRVAAFTFAVSVLTGLLFGLLPALRGTRVSLSETLKSQTRSVIGAGIGGGGRMPVGKLLIAAQMAFSLLLLIVAALFARSLQQMMRVDVGFDREHLLVARIDARSAGYTAAELPALYRRLLDRVAAIPGVDAASLSSNGPFSNSQNTGSLEVEGYARRKDEQLRTNLEIVTPEYFRTVGLRIVRGRPLGPEDVEKGRNVSVINQTMARRYFRDRDPIGKRWGWGPDFNQGFEIVGVAQDARYLSVKGDSPNMVYRPLAQQPGSYLASLEVRTTGAPGALAEDVRNALRQSEPRLVVASIDTLDDRVARSLGQERLLTWLTLGFGAIALFLACLGLYGTISYAVSRRTAELGVRMALGASRATVQWLILREALVLVLVGLAVGVPLALFAARAIPRLLFVTPLDPIANGAAIATLVLIAALAAYLPARRASRVDPMQALRAE